MGCIYVYNSPHALVLASLSRLFSSHPSVSFSTQGERTYTRGLDTLGEQHQRQHGSLFEEASS